MDGCEKKEVFETKLEYGTMAQSGVDEECFSSWKQLELVHLKVYIQS